MVKKYFNRHFQFEKVFNSREDVEEGSAPKRKRKGRGFFIFVRILKLLPWLCLTGFGVSFFLQYTSDPSFQMFGLDIIWSEVLRVVAVGGLIGFGTNWVAIKMLFKPVVRRPIWGQGLIPAQKDRIVWQLAGGIHRHILNEDLIRSRIEASGMIGKINRNADRRYGKPIA